MKSTEGASILTPADIHHIRTFIDDKYPDKPQSEKSEIVADAIRRIINQHLPDFAETVKKELTSRLVRKKLLGSVGTVHTGHIFEACLDLDIRDQRIVRPLRNWVERKLDVSVEDREFQRVLRLVNSNDQQKEQQTPLDAVARELNAPVTVTTEPQASSSLEKRDTASLLSGMPSTRILLSAVFAILLLGGLLVYIWSLVHKSNGADTMPIVSASPLEKQAAAGGKSQAFGAPDKNAAAAATATEPEKKATPTFKNELPKSLQYSDIQYEELKAFLESRSSMLAEPKYMNAIIKAARHYNIDPLLLFAITGQEQSFVPEDHDRAKEMANNPFNVYYSWQSFNTTIEESSMIAAKTVVNLSKNRPEDQDPINWINRKYAEDENWSVGVNDILDMLEDIAA
ncbi:Mannosyl-glycoprotein endo-beta-N-acetylglucosaminidase [Paenibacillaceae bacterium GAS479]|nr:Mannosyl-glycoprotein endo-beta-N-acetylglucosaminidase [Paenibacillaceae bacterium GAS479]